MSSIIHSIVFSIRNRAKELEVALPTLLKYDQKTVEIVCMDDRSMDGSQEIAEQIFRKFNWTNYRFIKSPRQSDGYDKLLAAQLNLLVEEARGEYILMQSAEVAHIDNILEMTKYCLLGQPVFATVINAVRGEHQKIVTRKASSLVFKSMPTQDPVVTIFDYTALSPDLVNIYPYPRYQIQKADGSFSDYETYTSLARPLPMFFCGMIKKTDWLRLGGYAPVVASDIRFWYDMNAAKFQYAFTSLLAHHVSHGKA